MTNINGAIITDSVIEQVCEWQDPDNMECDLMAIEDSIDVILDQNEVTTINSETASKNLRLVKNLRDLAKSIRKFKKEGDSHE